MGNKETPSTGEQSSDNLDSDIIDSESSKSAKNKSDKDKNDTSSSSQNEEVYGGTALKQYFHHVSKTSHLTKAEEKVLGLRIRAGDKEALSELIESNLKFVITVVNRYKNLGVPMIDLINQGNLGLVEAAKRFNPDKDVKFISYAIWWIRQSVIQLLAEQVGAVRLPTKQAGLLYRINIIRNKYIRENSSEPNSEYIAEQLDLEPSDVDNILRVSRNYLSLENPIKDGENRTFMDMLESQDPGTETQVINKSLAESLNEIISNLNERERDIIKLRFGLGNNAPETLEIISKKLGISRERVRQIELKAIEKLREKASLKNLSDYLN